MPHLYIHVNMKRLREKNELLVSVLALPYMVLVVTTFKEAEKKWLLHTNYDTLEFFVENSFGAY